MKHIIITALLITSASPLAAQEKPRGQQETYQDLRDRPYANRTTQHHRTPPSPYSNEAQAEVRQAKRIYREIKRDEDPGYYVFKTRPGD